MNFQNFWRAQQMATAIGEYPGGGTFLAFNRRFILLNSRLGSLRRCRQEWVIPGTPRLSSFISKVNEPCGVEYAVPVASEGGDTAYV